jgi:tRNASer (uridine44-2'-O)-methyltransferase
MSRPSLPFNLEDWHTSTKYQQRSLNISTPKFLEVTDLLLENPNLNSTNLFRADILSDSAHILKTNAEKERHCEGQTEQSVIDADHDSCAGEPRPSPEISGASLRRTVVRRLIPRNQQLDKPLDQTCFIYELAKGGLAVLYIPHVEREEDMPWYHPPIRALTYVYEPESDLDGSGTSAASLSIRYLPFQPKTLLQPTRLHRTLLSLLATFIRLAKHPTQTNAQIPNTLGQPAITQSTLPSALKDTLIPQHLVQNTYARLKQTYATHLIASWVESTPASKHVFEDLMIAAFLIELWKSMYHSTLFRGFVDIACGNGVLVYILTNEGYKGWGFDARKRKTWDALRLGEAVQERVCVPRPFLDVSGTETVPEVLGVRVHEGLFEDGTFVISNHADELTVWTPILAAMSNPGLPLPFLAIPCCSHALSGAKHRYNPKDVVLTKVDGEEEQSKSGDLKVLRAQKQVEASHADDKSMYVCLTRKVVAVAEELGGDAEMTLMRIPSTRNIGVVGGRKRVIQQGMEKIEAGMGRLAVEDEQERIQALIKRECSISGGLEASARTWIERAQKLHTGKGRGKVNLGHKPTPVSEEHS